MRAILLAAVLAAVSAPAFGQDHWYADLGGAYTILDEQTVNDARIPGGRGELAAHDGFGVTGALGFDYGNGLRTEGELGYRRNGLDKVTGGAFGAVMTSDVDGHVSAFSGLLNLFYDYRNKSRFTPYIGGGVGAASVTVDSSALGVDDSDLVFAYQFMGGVAYAVSESVKFRLGYRFFATTDPEIQGSETEYFSNNLEFGVTVGF